MISSNLLVTVVEHDPQNNHASLTDESSIFDSPAIEDVVPRSSVSPRKSTKLSCSLKTNMKDTMNQLPFNHWNDSSKVKGVKFVDTAATAEENYDAAYDDDNETNVTSIETKNVERIRSAILTTLIFSFLLVGVVLYFKVSADNEEDFYVEYNGAVEMINISIQSRIIEKMNILDALGTLALNQVAIMSTNTNSSTANISLFVSSLLKSNDDVEGDAALSKSNWPFVTIPNFEQSANNFKQLSDSLYLGINPIVTMENRMLWEDYVRTESSIWMSESIQFGLETGMENFGSFWNENHFYSNTNNSVNDSTPIYYTSSETVTEEGQSLDTLVYSIEDGNGPYVPIWQTSPLMRSMINQNTLRYSSTLYQDMQRSIDSNSIVLGNLMTTNSDDTNNFMSSYFASLLSTSMQSETRYEGDPMTHIYFPIHENLKPSYSIDENNTKPPAVAVAVSLIQWGSLFTNVLPSHSNTIVAVLESSCYGNFTYYVTGQDVQYAGTEGDYHDEAFDQYVTNITLDDFFMNHPSAENETIQSVCSITFYMYPTTAFYEESVSMLPATIGWVLFVLLMMTIFSFVIFDRLVERRQSHIEAKAQVTGSILTSLFPKDVANRLITQSNLNNQIDHSLLSNKHRLKSFLNPDNFSNDDGGNMYGLEPIADLFPATTVLFSDIAGFTAWSSSREPCQVFVLLQSVYQGFDMLARRRRVFKVETIGDSYVAVTGVPDPQEHHALIMARFATECQQKMAEITHDLVVKLGPDTSDLRMRMGMHSGPVTGGVLVGDRARFQLFGDTVNTAARMESTGIKEKIQISLETANLIMAAGKTHWLTPRKDPVVAKGKGVLVTYWLNLQTTAASRTSFSSYDEPLIDDSSRNYMDDSIRPLGKSMRNAFLSNPDQTHESSTPSSVNITGVGSFRDESKYDRLIDWLSEVLQSHILRVIASRTANTNLRSSSRQNIQDPVIIPTGPPMNEVVEAIFLPEYQSNYKKYRDRELDLVELNPVVVSQLREYVAIIARCYKDNPFHNFEHACHVTMSVNKLLMRITTPDIALHKMARKATQAYRQLHEYTHGINSDSITQLGIIFSAIIHDVDHQGISNVQLCKEQPELATKYNSQSVAEQNSLDIAWDLLMSDQFKLLRNCIFKTVDELQRFRQVLVNTVLATDIFDKELKELRQKRWETAFSSQIYALGNEHGKNLQATIVIEHLMQASDVSHTMQHWHVYRKWNARLFKELYLAFRDGRMAGNPCEFWYNGELGFFDNYIIPLAKKLKECNVFGVSSDEYLNYAEKNREEWAIRGEEIVSEMILEVTRSGQD